MQNIVGVIAEYNPFHNGHVLHLEKTRAALAGDMAGAREMHAKYYPLFHDLFIDVNPVMVKEALAIVGRVKRVFRLPLCETTPQNLEQIKRTLVALGLV